MDLLHGQKQIAETLGKMFKKNSYVSDVHYVRDSTGRWWFTVWYRGGIKPTAVEREWKEKSLEIRHRFGFEYSISYEEDKNGYRPKPSLPMDLTPSTGFEELPEDYGEEYDELEEAQPKAFNYPDDIDEELSKPVPHYSRPSNIDPDTKIEEPEYIYNDDGVPIAPANGMLTPPKSSIGKRVNASSSVFKKWGQGAITVSIEHWVSQEQYRLKQSVYEFMSDFIKKHDYEMTQLGQKFWRDAQNNIMAHDTPEARNMLRMVIPLSDQFFIDDQVFEDTRAFAEGVALLLNQKLVKDQLFAPVFYMHHAAKDYRILMQPGPQKDMIKAMNIYSKVLCHMNG